MFHRAKCRMIGAVSLLISLASPALSCSTTTPCTLQNGSYHIALPDSAGDGPVPAVVWVHGFGGSGQGIFRNTGLTNALLTRGYAVIAPNGMKREGRSGRSWSFHPNHPNMPQRRDEIMFLTDVRDDAAARYNIDLQRIVLAGFSIGGSMTSYLACTEPDAFTAYAPVGGSFWRPHPASCVGPVKLLHTHGWRDGTVPLEGRVLRGTDATDPDMLAQGDVFEAMQIWRRTNECHQLKADEMETSGPFWTRTWTRCAPGSGLRFVLFPGGHSIPKGWADMALDWFETQ